MNRLEYSIRNYFHKNRKTEVDEIHKITSSMDLPEIIGDYNITEEVKEDTQKYIDAMERTYFLVKTEDENKPYLVRMAKGKNEVLKTRNLFKILHGFYKELNKKSIESEHILDSVNSELEDEVELGGGKLKEQTYKKFQAEIYGVISLLDEAKSAAEKLKKSVSIYPLGNVDISKKIKDIEKLRKYHSRLSNEIDSLDIYVEEPREFIMHQNFD